MLEQLCPVKNNKNIQHAKVNVQKYHELITFVGDRPGHDRRYAINCDKLKTELGWKQRHQFADGIRQTIAWYLDNSEWVDKIRSGEYAKWIEKNYGMRTGQG
jgi:dTDP-glucose 4,6-dehydratase